MTHFLVSHTHSHPTKALTLTYTPRRTVLSSWNLRSVPESHWKASIPNTVKNIANRGLRAGSGGTGFDST